MANRSHKHQAELDARERRLLRMAQLRQRCRKPSVAVAEYMSEFGVSKQTYYNDRREFMERLRGETDSEVQAYRTAQLEELDELREVAHDQSISKKDRVTLILSILDREIDLVGSAAPSRSITAHVDGTGRFHETVSACAGLDDQQYADVLAYAKSLQRKELPMPEGPPMLLEAPKE